jgi:vancomycin resistance protein YoaR
VAKKKKGSAWKKIGVGVLVLGVAGGGALAMAASQYVPTVAPSTKLGDVSLTGLTRAAAAKAVTKWFEDKKSQPLALVSDDLAKNPEGLTAESLGVALDVEATLARAPMDTFWTSTARQISSTVQPTVTLEPAYKFEDEKFADLATFVADNAKPNQKARVTEEGGTINREPEAAGVELNPKDLPQVITKLMNEGGEAELPLEQAAKRVPDSELEKITSVVAEFTTRFNAGQVARCYNIKRASEIINGTVLMPGEVFKFNEFVGRRTTEGGFRTAGVYVNGRHDYDVGGGICQVSTTLYNAALLSDLKIKQRSNHSLPVAYVPLGRDATVSFPAPELAIENTRDAPIAIVAHYEPGRLNFKILSTPEPGLSVKIEQGAISSWSNGIKYVEDGSLGFGQQKVVDRGGSGRRVSTVRVVYKDGVEVRRESLGTSIYRGGPKIVARNSKAAPPTTTQVPANGPGTPVPNNTPTPGSPAGTPKPGTSTANTHH